MDRYARNLNDRPGGKHDLILKKNNSKQFENSDYYHKKLIKDIGDKLLKSN